MTDNESNICRLCLQQAELCNSHIFPEFFYRPMYDDKGRFYMISSEPEQRTLYKQQGVYEKLLCAGCEARINTSELHAKTVFYDKMQYDKQPTPGLIKVVNLNYKKFKLFQLSLLWRAGIAKHRFFGAIRLGPHEDILRKMIFDENPGKPHEYGCVIIGLSFEKGQAFDVVIQPEKVRIDSHVSYRFTLGSCAWVYTVSNHTASFDKRQYFVQEDGTMLLQTFPAKEVPFIRKNIDDFIAKGKFQ